MANINRVQFASKDTRRLLPGWILWPPDAKNIDVPRPSGSPWIIWPGCKRLSPPTQLRLDADKTQRQGKQVQDGSSGQKVLLKWSEDSSFASLDYSDRLGDHTKYQADRVKISTRPPPHHSQTQFGSASTQVHQEECNPPSRRVHKVRKTWHTESEYPLR